MSTLEVKIPASQLQVGDVIINQFGARAVTHIVRTVYTTFYHTDHCIECSCSNQIELTIRRAP